MPLDLEQATLAVGALGTAALALVDTTKVVGGGISRAGFRYIKDVASRLVLLATPTGPAGLHGDDIVATLRANWMNGVSMADQKAAAKALIKLHFTPSTAAQLARETNVDPAILASVASKLSSATPLTLEESDVYGRFDLAIAAMLDYAYQRGDQFYRNSCKTLAAVFAVALAVAGNQELT